jgi:hypothetical protein
VQILDVFREIKTPEMRLAWVVAIFADALQIGITPMFAEGAFSPADSVLDVITATILIRLIGWHWAFLPSFFAELLPGFDLFPTWTAAMLYVTHRQVRSGEPEIIPPGPLHEAR